MMMNIDHPSLVILNGVPNSGKTHLMRYMLYLAAKQGKVDWVVVFSPTKFTGAWDMIKNQKYVHAVYEESTLEKFLQIQEREKKRAILIFDDCIGTTSWQSKLITKLISTYRHYNLSIWIVTQNCNKIPPLIRDCTSHVFIFECYAKRQMEGLFNSFGNRFETFDQFRTFLKENTSDHHFIFYKKKTNSEEATYQVLRAPSIIPKFKLVF